MLQSADVPKFKKITKIDSHGGSAARLEAKGQASLQINCGRVGTSVSITKGGKGYSFVIAKGSLASVSFSNKNYPILKYLAIIAMIYGVVEYLDSDEILSFLPGVTLFLIYLITQSTQLSLESKGGNQIAMAFTGSAGRKADQIGKFCSAAVMIDTGQSIKGLLDGIDLEELEREEEAFASSSENDGGSPAVGFSDIDTDGDGSISQGEFVAAVGNDEVLFSRMDADGDGEISQEEFDEFDDF
tara:strand:- start:55 stop:783 length:729 start_codon:yes stop_codon:yes gene_type:complete